MNVMTRVSTIALLLAASSAFASTCDTAALPSAPSIPAATERDTASMLAAQESVKSYIGATKNYLKCVRSSRTHNALVDKVYAVADEYNSALQEFKASTR